MASIQLYARRNGAEVQVVLNIPDTTNPLDISAIVNQIGVTTDYLLLEENAEQADDDEPWKLGRQNESN